MPSPEAAQRNGIIGMHYIPVNGHTLLSLAHDLNGNLTRQGDVTGKVTKYGHDADRNLMSLRTTLGSEVLADNHYRLTAHTRGGVTREYKYDNAGCWRTAGRGMNMTPSTAAQKWRSLTAMCRSTAVALS